MLRNPLFSKILVICLLALLLLIPLGMIQSKISERKYQQIQVQQDIARTSSGPQIIAGPYVVIRYKLRERRTSRDGEGNERITMSESGIKEAVISPHSLKVDGTADVETRSRGIYQANLFNLHARLAGDFVVPRGYGINRPLGDIIPVSAHLVVNVSDSRGIHNVPLLTLNGKPYEFAPGGIAPVGGNGMNVALGSLDVNESHAFNFDFPLELQGMASLSVLPSGNNTAVSLKSSWPHPSFGGGYLPRTRNVDESGFSAQWLVTNLARNSATQMGGEEQKGVDAISVDFIDPVNVYLLSERAVKYGIMFVVLVFTAFFMFELLRSMRIHPMQYLLVGLAMAVFFLLLISLSEHLPFLPSYVASGAACAALIGLYLAGVLRKRKPAVLFSGGIALMYAVLYGVLQSEDNALLMGTMILFGALAAVMMLTRNMNWYELNVPGNPA